MINPRYVADEVDIDYRTYKIWRFENDWYMRSEDESPFSMHVCINNFEVAKFIIDILFENKELKNRVEEIEDENYNASIERDLNS